MPIPVTSLSPAVVSDDGGDLVTITGTFPTGDIAVFIVDGVVETPCYSGRSGSGNAGPRETATTLTFVAPPLTRGGPYSVRVRQGAEEGTLFAALTVRNRSFNSRVYSLRSVFPPALATGPQALDLTDPLALIDFEPAAVPGAFAVYSFQTASVDIGGIIVNSTATSPGTRYNAALARHEPGGAALWAVPISCPSQVQQTALTVDESGAAVYVAVMVFPDGSAATVTFGTTSGSTIAMSTVMANAFSGGQREAFIAKYDLNGVVQWVRRIGPTTDPGQQDWAALTLAPDPATGNITVKGRRIEKSGGVGVVTTRFMDDGAGGGQDYARDDRLGYGWTFQVDALGQIVTAPATLGIHEPDALLLSGLRSQAKQSLPSAHSPTGRTVMGGFTANTGGLNTYSLNKNTGGPTQIGGGQHRNDGWLAVQNAGAAAAAWEMHIENTSTSIDRVDSAEMVGEEVVAAGQGGTSPVAFRGTSTISLTFAGTAPVGWIARVDSAGNPLWVKAIENTVANTLPTGMAVDGTAGLIHISSRATGTLTFGPGEAGQQVVAFGGNQGAFVAQFNYSTGDFVWVVPITTSAGTVVNTTSVRVDESTGDVYAAVYLDEDATIAPGAPEQIVVSAVGEAVVGVVRIASDGTLQSFTELFRQPAATSVDVDVIRVL